MITEAAHSRLLQSCIRNERSAQKELYKLYYSYGMSICLRYTNSKDEAAEVLNNAFMKLFKYLSKFDLNRPFKPWFSKIVVNAAVDHYQQQKKQLEAESLDHAEEVSAQPSIIEGISYQEIIDMMQQLPPSYRTVFNLHVIEGYTHEEIAGMLGVSVGATKSNLFKARNRLKEILEKVLDSPYER